MPSARVAISSRAEPAVESTLAVVSDLRIGQEPNVPCLIGELSNASDALNLLTKTGLGMNSEAFLTIQDAESSSCSARELLPD